MIKLVTLSAVATLFGGIAYAADAPTMSGPAAVSTSTGAYVELLGGASLAGTVSYWPTYDNDYTENYGANFAGAAALGYEFMPGLSAELDLFYANHDYTYATVNETLRTTSVMANLKYTLDLNDTFSLFGALGLGGIYLYDHYDSGVSNGDYGNGWGLGYAAQIGVAAKLTDNLSALLEYRYENTFNSISWGGPNGGSEQTPTSAVLAGLKLGF